MRLNLGILKGLFSLPYLFNSLSLLQSSGCTAMSTRRIPFRFQIELLRSSTSIPDKSTFCNGVLFAAAEHFVLFFGRDINA